MELIINKKCEVFMHYTKLFSSIIHSTIWREPDHIRLVWITMLAMKERDGTVQASIPGLADAARVSLEQCQEALKVLKAPDQFSRSHEHDGRRIEDADGGWLLLNSEHYRKKMDADDLREYKRIWAANNRSRKRVEKCGSKLTELIQSESESDSKKEKTLKKESKEKALATNFKIFWNAYPKKIGKKNCEKWWEKQQPDEALTEKMVQSIAICLKSKEWVDGDGKFIPHPLTWLNGERWNDEGLMQPKREINEFYNGRIPTKFVM